MFHQMSVRSFCEKFVGDQIIIVGNDIGPLRCFESIGAGFSQEGISIYAQSRELKNYIQRTEFNFLLETISFIRLFFKILFSSSCTIMVLQSSYVSLLERLVVKKHKNVYVIQDYKNDFKFGTSVKYVTAFASIPSMKFKNVSIYVLEGLRPRISSHDSDTMDSSLLLVIGAKKLLLLEGCMDFFNTLVESSQLNGLKMHYKPHPAEDVTEYGEGFFHAKGVALISELPIEGAWPKYIVSPHSTLGYDIPEKIALAKKQKFRVLHSFGAIYDKRMWEYPGFEPMPSTKSLNFDINQCEEFFHE